MQLAKALLGIKETWAQCLWFQGASYPRPRNGLGEGVISPLWLLPLEYCCKCTEIKEPQSEECICHPLLLSTIYWIIA